MITYILPRKLDFFDIYIDYFDIVGRNMKLISKKELTPISYGELGYKVISFNFLPNNCCFSDHWHDRLEILKINDGKIRFYRNDNCYHLSKGDIAIVCPQQLHTAFTDEDSVSYDVVMFDVKMLLNGVFSTEKLIKPILEQNVLFAPYTDNKEIYELVEMLINESKINENSLTCLGLLYSLIDKLYKFCLIEKDETIVYDEKINVVINYIHENFAEKISSYTVSKRFNYDEAYFCRKFKMHTGTTLMKYLKKIRLDMAKRLLEESEVNIRSISETCGFADVTYFSRCFKTEFGMSPTQYVKLYKN